MRSVRVPSTWATDSRGDPAFAIPFNRPPMPSLSWRGAAAATVVGALLRAGSFAANLGFPHGDVHLDAATAESLAAGRGFWTPWEEGTTLRPDAIGASPAEMGHAADQHGPLWPLLGALPAKITGDGVLALQILSLLAGIATIPVAARLFGRWGPRAGAFAAWACALALPLCDYSGNGSLYAAQTLGVLALPLVAGELARARDALAAGAWIGLLILLNYQCAALAPAFAAAVVVARGARASLRPIGLAAIAGAVVVSPWLARNAAVFGDPFFTTNFAYVAGKIGKVSVELAGERPRMVVGSVPLGELAAAAARWIPVNFAVLVPAMHLALPVLPFFAPGGLARLVAREPGARPAFAGAWVVAAFVALLAAAVAWPTPKSRYVVPLVAFAAGASMVELTRKPRFLWAAAAAAVSAALAAAIDAPAFGGFPWLETVFLLPTLVAPALALAPRAERWLPVAALAAIAAHGAFRVALQLDRELACRAFGLPPSDAPRFGPPTATFYDVMGAPFTEGPELLELRELEAAADLLATSRATVVVGPIEIARRWRGGLVSPPARSDSEGIRRTLAAFRADACVVRSDFPLTSFLSPDRAPVLLHGPTYRVHRLRAP